MKIAFLGLGIMGRPMATKLSAAGHDVTVWNRTVGKTVEGAKSSATPREAANGAEVVWICVSDTAAVEHVLFGPDGVVQSIVPGMVVVDSSTISPTASRKFAERVRAKGAEFLDAPITGSKIAAEGGTLIFMVGGAADAIERVRPAFMAMGKQVIHMGKNGDGEAAKLAMNLMIVLIYEGFAEALTLATKLGVDQKALFTLIQSSMVRSGVVDYKMPFVEKSDFSPNFPLRLMHKDIRLMMEAAAENGVELPALETAKQIYDEAHAAGLDDMDYAVTLQLIKKRAGIE